MKLSLALLLATSLAQASSMHVFEANDKGEYRICAHVAVPAGNNTVGNSWKDVIIASGRNVTVMATGTGIGQISTAEQAQIAAGDVVEVVVYVAFESATTNAQRTALVNVHVTDELALLQRKLKLYGRTQ